MTTTFTPGPWLYRGKSDAVYTPPTDPTYQYGSQIFRFHDEDGPDDVDLELILAAPDLYAALKEAVRALDVGGFGVDCETAALLGRTALAKAEGKAP